MSTSSLERAWGRGEAERRFWEENYDRILERYPEQFVAVRDGEVVAAQPELEALLARLSELGLGAPDVTIEFVTAEPQKLYL